MAGMSAGDLKGVRFPGRYIQGPGALARPGSEVAAFGPRALVLLDDGVFNLFEGRVKAAFASCAEATILRFGGECTEIAIADTAQKAGRLEAAVIVGMGGGKALDTAKAAAIDAGLPMIVVPTIAASDAPCSALSVIYHADGTVSHDRFLPHNPDLVLVDTAIIAAAPARFLAAGNADALATWYESESCRRSGALNCLGLPGLPLAFAIAATCRDTILAHSLAAMAECIRGDAGPALERIVEANILMSGLGFESGGVAAAHAVYHGLAMLEDTHNALHGEKVAIGILTGLAMQNEDDEFKRVKAFMQSIGLPTRCADLGISELTDEKLWIVANRACKPGEIILNEPFPVTPEAVFAALQRLG
ncbi:MAG: glycerol dehydrogenase [bacterium]